MKSPAYLEAVLKRPFLATFGITCYPYVADKIAILIHSMIATPVFEEVKNRTAMGLGLAVAKANGQRILPIDGQEIEDVAIGVAIHAHDMADTAQWLTMRYQLYGSGKYAATFMPTVDKTCWRHVNPRTDPRENHDL